MPTFDIPELGTVLEKLNAIEKIVLQNGMPDLLTAERAAEKYGIDKQTLAALAKEHTIEKYKLKRRIYYSSKEIDNAIYKGIVKPFNPKALKR
ncbi:MAG: helix-turn-helix domain-containing protein [Bacteroidales bacterium]